MRVKSDAQSVGLLTARGLTEGGQLTGPIQARWEAAGDCLNPVPVEHVGRPMRGHPSGRYPLSRYLDMTVRCRKCDTCLRARSALWRSRARAEILAARRTWFGTLTLNPEWQVRCIYEAERRALKRRAPIEDTDSEFAHRVAAIAPQLTLWLKRVRKVSGSPLRYILVAERHKSGMPHWHYLMHEVSDSPVSYRQLTKQWPCGFAHAKLVDDAACAAYVAKYLAKDAAARVRASLRYGSPTAFAKRA